MKPDSEYKVWRRSSFWERSTSQ